MRKNKKQIKAIFRYLSICEIVGIVLTDYTIVVYFKDIGGGTASLYLNKGEHFRKLDINKFDFYADYDWTVHKDITKLLESKDKESNILALQLLIKREGK